MVEKTSHMFITGPEVIKAVTKEVVDKEASAGPWSQCKSGVVTSQPRTTRRASRRIRSCSAFYPRTTWKTPPGGDFRRSDEREEGASGSCSVDPNQPYDIRDIILSTSTIVTSSKPTSTMRATSSWASAGWTGCRSG